MEKIKRNKKLDGLLTDIKLRCMHEQKYTSDGILEGFMASYKKCETKNYVITSAEADNIISALKSMPGFSIEKFLVIFGMFGMENSLGSYEMLVNTFGVAYYMLSITNPELFEEASDENHEV